MKVGQLFDLPENVPLVAGHVGNVRDNDEKYIIAKYEVIEVEGELKGRVMVTYRNRRCKNGMV